jgi:V8-like Glu-specific endopeptidase
MKLVQHMTVVLLSAAATWSCGSAPDSTDGTDLQGDLQQVHEPIYNGTTVTTTGLGYPLVFTKQDASGVGSLCSSTLLTNNWILTAKHCHLAINSADPSYTTQVILDYGTSVQQSRVATQIVLHPNWDIALVKVNSPFDMNGSPGYPNYFGFAKRMYPWNDLLNQTVTGWGYGANAVSSGNPVGAGVFRKGVMSVSQTNIFFNDEVANNNPGIALLPNPNQLIFSGDSGGPVTYSTPMRPNNQSPDTLAAVTVAGDNAADGHPVQGYAIPTAAISQWAIATMYPNQVFICHGVECMTTRSSLANNTGLDTTWMPCGGYRTYWEAQISFESGWDFFYVNGRAFTGTSTFSGTEPAGTPISLQIRTDGSVQSAGVQWFKVRCVQ